MIITKGVTEVSGYIEYRYDYETSIRIQEEITDEIRDSMFESDRFHSLSELLEKIKPEVLEKIKEDYNAEKVWISCIAFTGKSEDGQSSTSLSFVEDRCHGHIATEIDNKDIQERAFLNMKKIKEIVDNTLDSYPVKY